MAIKYVRFAPGIEQTDPEFTKKAARIREEILATIHRSTQLNGKVYATRDAHVKGYGLLKAEFEIFADLLPELAQGLYAKPGKHDAVIRYSNASARNTADLKAAPFAGMAIKIFDVAGQTLLDDEPDSHTFDYNLISIPVLFCSSLDHYVYMNRMVLNMDANVSGGPWRLLQLGWNILTAMGTAFPTRVTIRELLNFVKLGKLKPYHLLLNEYYTAGAVRHGAYIAKVRVKPVQQYADQISVKLLNLKAAAEVYRPALIAELQQHDFQFEVQVQLCTDLKKMPVEDLSIQWSEKLSPFVTVGRLYIPRQDISGEENEEKMEHLSFTPFRCLEENRPLGSLQRVRKEVYRATSKLRHQLNEVPRWEPENLEELFGSRE